VNVTNVTGPNPSPGWYAAAAYDEARQRVVVLGGGDTWEYEPVVRRWTLTSIASPQTTALAYDPDRHVTVAEEPNGATWEWDGVAWRDVTPRGFQDPDSGVVYPPDSGALPAFERPQAWWDPVRRRVTIGGTFIRYPGRAVAVYEWDGTSWRERPEGYRNPVPEIGDWPAVAFDALRQRIVVFRGSSPSWPSTTCELGAAWVCLNPQVTPTVSTAMAWDAPTQRTVLVGDGTAWTWDGTAWSEMADNPGPLGREKRLVFDTTRSRLILFHAQSAQADGSTQFSSVWEF
jgi:hypothetical protein